MEQEKRKQLTFDIDTNVAKKILGESGYTNIYKHIRGFMEKKGWIHIEGSVYMSQKPMSNTKVAFDVNQLKKQYPYIGKCVKTMHQADISNVHGLSHYFDYDGTPGKYTQKETKQADKASDQHTVASAKSSFSDRMQKKKDIVKSKEKTDRRKDVTKKHDRDSL